jgi:glycosyltransferase involved in cell wall biosynthesis
MRYAIISPVRDEAAYLPKTIKSIVNQTIQPMEWVIVNDGSTDHTAAVVDDAAARLPWLHAVHRANRGYRKSGGGVVEAFDAGYQALRSADWDFIVKLDGDLSFAPEYFERCFEYFSEDPKLGIGGGAIYNLVDGKLVLEACPRFHVRGATKIYRRDCWEALGGLLPAPGWDTLDEVKAQMKGWTTRTFSDLPLTHYRYTGSAEGLWRGLVKNGRASYICGYHPLFMAARCTARLIHRPFAIGSLALAYGYISGYITGLRRVNDPQLIQFLRGQQLRRLMGRQSIWR